MTEGPHDKKIEQKVQSQKHVTGHLKCTTGGRAAVTWISIKNGGKEWTGFMWYSGKDVGSTVKKSSGSIKDAKCHY